MAHLCRTVTFDGIWSPKLNSGIAVGWLGTAPAISVQTGGSIVTHAANVSTWNTTCGHVMVHCSYSFSDFNASMKMWTTCKWNGKWLCDNTKTDTVTQEKSPPQKTTYWKCWRYLVVYAINGNWRCTDPWRIVLFQPMYLHLSPPPPLPFPRSWDQFHDCANMAMAGCPDEAAAVWESLRQESKKMQFSGNLYDMCSNRNNHPVASVSPRGSSNQEEINQESLRGRADHLAGCLHLLVLLSPLLLLLFWI